MTLPNFFVVGVPKAGTTSIYHYLAQHPQVYMSPVKEPRFFIVEGMQDPGRLFPWAERLVTDLTDYQGLFAGVGAETALGEASPTYFRSEEAAQRIHHLIPDAKIVVSLRHPVDRAFSHFSHALRDGQERCRDFRALFCRDLDDGPSGGAAGRPQALRYSWYGFYADSFERYFSLFGRPRIKIVLFDDFVREPVGTMREIYGFIGVDDRFTPDVLVKHNVSGIPRSRLLHRALRPRTPFSRALKRLLPDEWLSRVRARLVESNLAPMRLEPELRSELAQVYRDDLKRVERLTGLDLSQWSGPA